VVVVNADTRVCGTAFVGRVQWPRDGLCKVCYFSEAKCIISTFSQSLGAGGKCSVGKQKRSCYRTLVAVYTSNGKMCDKTRQFCLSLGGRRGWEFPINLDSFFCSFCFFFSPGATTPIGGCILQPSSGL